MLPFCRFALGSALSFALSAPFAVAKSQPKAKSSKDGGDAFLVVPGASAGKIQVGMARDKVLKILGKPKTTYTLPGGMAAGVWGGTGKSVHTVRIFFDREQVVQVAVTSDSFHTGTQLTSKSDEAAFRAVYPDATKTAFTGGHGAQGVYLDAASHGAALELTSPGGGSTLAGYALIIHSPLRPVILDADEQGTPVAAPAAADAAAGAAATGDRASGDQAAAADDCTFDPTAGQPALDPAKLPSFKATSAKYSLTETATLPDGVKVTYSAGGCDHLGYSFTFEGFPAGARDTAATVALAQTLLTETPVLKDSDTRQTLLAALGKSHPKPPENGELNLGCGDGGPGPTCYLVLGDPAKILLSFEFEGEGGGVDPSAAADAGAGGDVIGMSAANGGGGMRCDFQPTAWGLGLDQAARGLKDYKLVSNDQNGKVESAILANGVQVTYSADTCSDLDVTLMYTGVDLAKTDAATVVDTATALLNATPLLPAADRAHKALADALAKAKAAPGKIVHNQVVLPCANDPAGTLCGVEVGQKGVLTISYDMGLP
jgi:hypothetical protein